MLLRHHSLFQVFFFLLADYLNIGNTFEHHVKRVNSLNCYTRRFNVLSNLFLNPATAFISKKNKVKSQVTYKIAFSSRG